MSANDVLEREKNKENTKLSPAEQREFAALTSANHLAKDTDDPQDRVGRGYRPNDTEGGTKTGLKKITKKSAKKWGIGVLISLILGGGGVGVFNIFSGPGEWVHFAKVLTGSHMGDDAGNMDNRLGQLIRFMRTADAPEQRNLNYWGNKFANHYETKLKNAGVTPGYEGGRIKTMTIDTKTAAGQRARGYFLENGFDAASLKPNDKGIITVNIDRGGVGSARYRRLAIAGMVQTLDVNRVSAAMASRLLKTRAGVDFHPLKNIARAADEDIRDYVRKRKEERAQRIKNGVDTSRKSVSTTQNSNTEDPNANADNSRAGDAAAEANDILGDAADPNLSVEERSAKIRGRLLAGVGATGYLATICGVKAIGDSVGDLRYLNVVLPLMRVGMDVITTGNQIMAGKDVNADELGAFHEALYDEKTKTSWSDARSIQAELGQEQTGPDMPDAAKPGNADKPGFFKTLDSIINAIPGANGFCNAVNTTVGGWVLTAVGIASVATGPVSLIINAATEAAQYLLGGAFIDDLVRWLAGEQVDIDGTGAVLGNYANYGTRLAANDVAISHGGRELSQNEENILAMERSGIQREINSNQSLYARYLDLNNTHSVAAKILYETPALTNSHAFVASLARIPTNLFSAVTGPFSTLTTRQASADVDYNYGFPQFGFSLGEINGEGNKDPYYRAKLMEPRLAELNEAYGPCFNTTIDPTTFELVSGQAKRYDQLDPKCKDPNNADLVQYRFYIADMTAAKAAACYENIDKEVCRELVLE